MIKIIFTDAFGKQREVQAAIGASLKDTALENNIPGIVAECGGACLCATCQIYVAEEWQEHLPPKSQNEEEMLDYAFDVQPNSRLSCQIRITEELEGLIVTTPIRQS